MITIIAVGTIKEAPLRQLLNEYEKRLKKPYDIEWIEVSESKPSKSNHPSEIAAMIDTESMNILNKLKDDDYIYLCEISGKPISSVEFSQLLSKHFTYQSSRIVFVIGGSYGVNDSVKKRANASISFSKLTFPHQMFRLMIVEQIYRSYTIYQNITYHK